MARKRDRIFALVIAVLFFVSAFGLSFWAIWQATHSQDQTDTQNQIKEGQLQGTKLANFTPIAKIDQLQSIDTKEGTGDIVKSGATVTAHYTGAVASTGIIFQSSHDGGQPISFELDKVIDGWKQGVPGMKVGGIRRLLIPAAMGYGATPPPGAGIPPNADLVFDIEMVSVKNP